MIRAEKGEPLALRTVVCSTILALVSALKVASGVNLAERLKEEKGKRNGKWVHLPGNCSLQNFSQVSLPNPMTSTDIYFLAAPNCKES